MISIVVAMSENRVIGVKNQLPWHLPKDLKHFKEITGNGPVIMGSKTYDSLPSTFRPLPHRTNIVLTRQSGDTYDKAHAAHTVDEALAIAKKEDPKEIFIIGGGQVFATALPRVDRIYLTVVDTQIEDGEAFFPQLKESEWEIEKLGSFDQDEKHAYGGTFYQYNRRKHV